MKYRFQFYAMLVLSAGAHISAGAASVTCPPSVDSEAETIRHIDGWEVLPAPVRRRLTNAQVYDGHPNQEAALVPDEIINGKRSQARWPLQQTGRVHDYWLVCSYRDTAVTLASKLDVRFRQCKAEYLAEAGQPTGRLLRIQCD